PDGEPRASGWTCWSCWGSCHIEPEGSRTGNPYGDRVFLGATTAAAYKTESCGVCGRHLNLGRRRRSLLTVHLKPYWGKPAVRNFRGGRGNPKLNRARRAPLPYSAHNRGRWEFQRDTEFATRHGALGGTGGQFVDIDNDGDLDIVIADAHRRDGSRGPALLLNDWPNTRFVDAADVDPGNLLGRWSCAGDAVCVAADFNGDGKPDLLLAAMGRSPVLFVNATQGGNWLALDLLGQRGQ